MMLHENEPRKGYVNIPMRVNKLEITYRSKWREFLEENVFIQISNSPTIKEEGYKDVSFFGTALDMDDETEENEAEETDDTDECEDVCNYKKWQSKLTEILVETRKNNTPVARIDKKGGVSVVLLPKLVESEFKQRLEQAQEYHFLSQNLIPKGEESLTDSDVINLLSIRMLYSIAEAENHRIPEDRILDQYAVFFSKKDEDFQKINTKGIIYADDVKKSFLSLYVKNLMLHMNIVSYYQDGEWREHIQGEHRKKKVDNTFHYGACLINNNWYITNSHLNHGLGTKFSSKSKKKASLSIRSVSKEEKFHKNTKLYFADKMIYEFNKQYEGIIEISLKEWKCYQNEYEVSGKNGQKHILEQMIEDTNEIRLQIEKAGGLHFIICEAEELDEEENKEFINKCTMIADKLKTTYEKALYRGSTSAKDHIRKVEIEDTSDVDSQYAYKLKYKIDNIDTTISLKKNLETNCFEASIPNNIEKIKLEMYLSKELSLPLERELSSKVVFTTDNEIKEKTITFSYHSGFGIKNGEITRSNKLDMRRMNVHIILDKKTKIYHGSKSLRVQHCICNNEVAEFNPKAQTILRELGIKASVINQNIPQKGDIQAAIYIKHVPKDRKNKLKAYKRYYIYDALNHEEPIKETSEDELYELYEDLYLPNTYGDAYAVKINDTFYVIEKTDFVPMGTSLLDEDGNLLPVEQLKSKKREDYASNLPGYVGIIFYEDNMELYYSVTENRWFEEMTKTGVTRFPNFYKVKNDFQMVDITDELRESLTHSVVRLNRYTVVPSIFKYMKEWARTYGE